MKKLIQCVILLLCLVPMMQAQETVNLEFRIEHVAGERAYVFDQLVHATPAGTPFRVTRLSYLLSALRLQRMDGSWLEFPETYALVNAQDAPGRWVIKDVPRGAYRSIEWKLGVPPEANHSKPGIWSADHPMNPVVNNLHWTWQDGYIFLALEGRFRNAKAEQPGFIYHVANDAQLRTVTLPCKMELSADTVARVNVQVPSLFDHLDMVRDGSSTHSRDGDTLAPMLADMAAQAFDLVGSENGMVEPGDAFKGAIYPAGTTAYRLPLPTNVPQPPIPLDNPLTEEGIALGESLFNELALSRGNKQSCATCHEQEFAFSDPNRAFSLGVKGKPGTMNTMALFNLAWHQDFFWDGRAKSLREQVLEPIQHPLEMDADLDKVIQRLMTAGYSGKFERAFGSGDVTVERMALALEQFLFSLTSFNAKFDRAMAQQEAFTEEEKLGFQLFLMEHDPARKIKGADCFHCHGGTLLSNHRYFNNGLDADPPAGREAVTGDPRDRGKFKAPSLRNIALTAPYMHDGRFNTLEEVIDHYDHGVQRTKTLDANLAKHPPEGLGLTEEEKTALVAFLQTLTDERYLRSE